MSNDPKVPSKNDWALFFLICCGFVLVFVFAILPPNYKLPGDLCPAHRWLNLNCPGCGLTRAIQALSHGDFGKALYYNPLVLFVVPYLTYLVTTNIACVLFKRKIRLKLPVWFVSGFQKSFVIVWLFLAFVRTATWFYPQINPNNVFLPNNEYSSPHE